MEPYNIDQLREWLELTNQQFDIFKSIHSLERKKENTRPKNIQKEYTKIYAKGIERSNLFTIIKILIDKELIQKTDRANYAINTDGIQKAIDHKDKKFKEQYQQFQKAKENIDTYLSETLEKQQKPTIRFLTHDELFLNLANDLKYAKKYCLTVRAPSLVCSPAFYSMLNRKEYLDIMEQRVLKDKDLQVRWLTDLNFNMQFDRALKFLGDVDAATKEAINQINSIKNLIGYDNLEFNYIEHSIALKLFMPIKEKISECYIYLPGFSSVPSQGAIYVKSDDITNEIVKIFNNDCSTSVKVSPDNVNKIINKSKKILKEHIIEVRCKQNEK